MIIIILLLRPRKVYDDCVQFFEMTTEIERTDKIYRSRVETNADNRLNNVVSRYAAYNIKNKTCMVILYNIIIL